MNTDGIEPATLKPRDHKTTALTIVLSAVLSAPPKVSEDLSFSCEWECVSETLPHYHATLYAFVINAAR